ncbi:Hypothetical protein PHPALM_145 [Phytophthora palmivora]|uniref:PiggyBac transposable element-derived protein domain-containing protein n=1 Tax=Phytophthora palmivora TaxID=4796 RepID=A0A2P4YVJ0_9STRA|nr:Hypothetical protein PHPALM_145 [Phytophthora palmivora]
MKDKPHKWGTKVFKSWLRTSLTASVTSSFDSTRNDYQSELGLAAVKRNLDKVLPARLRGVYHSVLTVRVYSSAQFGLQLLAHNMYMMGTIQTNTKTFSSSFDRHSEKHYHQGFHAAQTTYIPDGRKINIPYPFAMRVYHR